MCAYSYIIFILKMYTRTVEYKNILAMEIMSLTHLYLDITPDGNNYTTFALLLVMSRAINHTEITLEKNG